MKRLLLLFIFAVSPAWATHASDNFTRANGPLGSNWVTVTANTPPVISSNGFTNGSGSADNNVGDPNVNGGFAVWRGSAQFGNDQSSIITFTAVGATGTDCIPSTGVRMSTASGGNGYFIIGGTNTTGTHPNYTIEVWKLVSGVASPLGQAAFSPTILVGDKIWIGAFGSLISAAYFSSASSTWSSIFLGTDASLPSGQPGIGVFLGSPGIDHPANTTIASTWSADDIPNQITLASDSFTEGGTLTDLFPYSNGDLHTANSNWTGQGISTFQVSSNQAFASNSGGSSINLMNRTDLTPPANQWARTTVVATGAAATQNTGPSVRGSASAATFYAIQYANNLNTVIKDVAGTVTVIIPDIGAPVTGDDEILTGIGNQLCIYRNSFQGNCVTDNSIASGNVGMFGTGNATVNGMSSWSGGSFSLPGNFSSLTKQQYVSDPTNGAYALITDNSSANPSTACATTGCLASLWENSVAWGANQFSQGTVTPASAPVQGSTPGKGSFGVAVRISTSVDTGYYCGPFNNGTTNQILLSRNLSGAGVTLVSATRAYTQNEVYKLLVLNDVLVCYVGGVAQLAMIDDSIASGKPGLINFIAGTSTTKTVKTWSAGGFPGGSTIAGPTQLAGPTKVN